MSGLGGLIVSLFGLAHEAGAFKGNKNETIIEYNGQKVWLYPETVRFIYGYITTQAIPLVEKLNKNLEENKDIFYGSQEGSGISDERVRRINLNSLLPIEEPFTKYQQIIDASFESSVLGGCNDMCRQDLRERGEQQQREREELHAKQERDRLASEAIDRQLSNKSNININRVLLDVNPDYSSKINEIRNLKRLHKQKEDEYMKKYSEIQIKKYKELFDEKEKAEKEVDKKIDDIDKDQSAFRESEKKKKEDFDNAVLKNAEYRLEQMGKDKQRVSGIKTCNSNTKSRDQIEHEAYQEEKKRVQEAEEAKARGEKLSQLQAISSRQGAGNKPKKINKRAEVVKDIMVKKGLSMIEASKYVKQHNLY